MPENGRWDLIRRFGVKLHYLYIMNLCNRTVCLLPKLKLPSVGVIQKLRAQKFSALAKG